MTILLNVWIFSGLFSALIAYQVLKDHQIEQPFPLNLTNKWHFASAILLAFLAGPIPFLLGILEMFDLISSRSKATKKLASRIRQLSKCPSCNANFIGEIKHIYARQIENEQFIWCENCVPDMVKEADDVIVKEKAPH